MSKHALSTLPQPPRHAYYTPSTEGPYRPLVTVEAIPHNAVVRSNNKIHGKLYYRVRTSVRVFVGLTILYGGFIIGSLFESLFTR